LTGVEKKLPFEIVTLVTVTGCELVTVTVIGCDVTLPLEPLKLRAGVEMLMPEELEALAQTGLARMIAARERNNRCFTTIAPGWGMKSCRLDAPSRFRCATWPSGNQKAADRQFIVLV
jgi:hypothetical protein